MMMMMATTTMMMMMMTVVVMTTMMMMMLMRTADIETQLGFSAATDAAQCRCALPGGAR